jgi:hypothetical protein
LTAVTAVIHDEIASLTYPQGWPDPWNRWPDVRGMPGQIAWNTQPMMRRPVPTAKTTLPRQRRPQGANDINATTGLTELRLDDLHKGFCCCGDPYRR